MSRVAVTGGTGFIGPHVVARLVGDGHTVRVLARRPERVGALEGAELVAGDMTDADSLRRLVEGCEVVVDLVAILLGSREAFERVMIKGTRDLVASAREGGARRFLLMSALGTGEETKDVSDYFRAKWEEERTVADSGLEHTIFRPSFVFGREGGILPGLLRLARWSPVMPVPSERRLQPVWVDDVAAYFAKAVAHGPTGIWELGGPDAVTWAELYERIRRTIGKRRLAVHVPSGLMRVGASAGELLPPLRGARGGVEMLTGADNVTDIGPAVAAFGIDPIGLDEQLQRAA